MIGFGAGFASAVMFVALIGGTMLALPLFFLAALPIVIAALGWGTRAGLAALAAAGTIVLVLIGPAAGLAHVVSIGAPVVFLCYLIGLGRAAEDGSGRMEWYPLGEAVFHATIICGLIGGAGLTATGYDPVGSTKALTDQLEAWTKAGTAPVTGLTRADLETFAAAYVATMPFAFPAIWMATLLFNLWLGGRIALRSGLLSRPWEPMWTIELPSKLAFVFIAAAFGMMAPEPFATFAAPFAGAAFVALVGLGLAVAHANTQGMGARGLVLAAVYAAIAVFGFPVLLVAALGLGEIGMKLRARKAGGGPPPPSPGGPPGPWDRRT